MLIKKILLVSENSGISTKINKNVSAKELLEEFIKLLIEVGYSRQEINEVLTRRKECKDLRCEIGKLKSYIDELEYKTT